MTRSRKKVGTTSGPVLGLLVFLGGICLLAFTFKLATDLFGQDPAKMFDLQPGKTLDLSRAGALMMGVVAKVMLLLVMAVVGGVIATRGIHLYSNRGAKGRDKSPKE